MIAYIGLDDVGMKDHMHVAGKTDGLLSFHSFIIANRQIVLSLASMLRLAAKHGWSTVVLHIFRGRSGLAMGHRLEVALRMLATDEGRQLLGVINLGSLTSFRSQSGGTGSQRVSGIRNRGSVYAEAMADAASRPFQTMTYELELDGRTLHMPLWIGYRGMDKMFEETSDVDAAFFLGVSGVFDVPSAGLFLPAPEDTFTYCRATMSFSPIDCDNIVNLLCDEVPRVVSDSGPSAWDVLTQLGRSVTTERLRHEIIAKGSLETSDNFKEKFEKKMITENQVFTEQDKDALRGVVPCASIIHIAARSSGFVSTREGIFTHFDIEAGAIRAAEALKVELLPGTAVQNKRSSKEDWNQ